MCSERRPAAQQRSAPRHSDSPPRVLRPSSPARLSGLESRHRVVRNAHSTPGRVGLRDTAFSQRPRDPQPLLSLARGQKKKYIYIYVYHQGRVLLTASSAQGVRLVVTFTEAGGTLRCKNQAGQSGSLTEAMASSPQPVYSPPSAVGGDGGEGGETEFFDGRRSGSRQSRTHLGGVGLTCGGMTTEEILGLGKSLIFLVGGVVVCVGDGSGWCEALICPAGCAQTAGEASRGWHKSRDSTARAILRQLPLKRFYLQSHRASRLHQYPSSGVGISAHQNRLAHLG